MTVALQIEQVGKTEVGKSKTHMECNGHWRRASSTGTGDQRQHSSTPTLPMAFPTQGQKWSKTSMHRSVTAQCLERSGRTMRHETHSWFQLPAHSAGESSALCWCPSRWLLPPAPHAPVGAALTRRVWRAERWRVRRRAALPYGIAIAFGGTVAFLTSSGS